MTCLRAWQRPGARPAACAAGSAFFAGSVSTNVVATSATEMLVFWSGLSLALMAVFPMLMIRENRLMRS